MRPATAFFTITTRALAAATATLALGAWVSSTPREIELNPEPSGASVEIDTMALAKAHADRLGLTGCVAPADAELDDVFLTLASDLDGNPTTDRVREVDLDTALDSAGKRLVLLACDKEQS